MSAPTCRACRTPAPLRQDLAETVKEVEALDRRIVAAKADVRDYGALKQALDDGVAQLGRLDIVSANAGIGSSPYPAPGPRRADLAGHDRRQPDRGVALGQGRRAPHLIEGGRGGAIVLTSSAAGLQAYANVAHYVSAKHGVVGLMRTLALELAPHSIRVNSIHPTQVDTPMIQNEATYRLFRPDLEHPTGARLRARVPGHERAADPLGRAGQTSATRCCSWPPTRPATSPGSRCPWTRGPSSSNGHHGNEQGSSCMAGRVAGKIAFITGAGRGQGRSHAIRLAEEGADIIAVDICHNYDTVGYGMSTEADLADTVKQVEALDRRIVATQADVRDPAALKAAVDDGVAQLGHLDIVCANAGICTVQAWDEVTPAVWQDTLDTNLTGVWNTMVACAPHLIAAGGGSIICTSSTAGIKGLPFLAPYVAAKHGVVGIARTMANELAQHRIRVNTVHPTGVNTPMVEGLGGLDPLIERDPNLGPIFVNTLPVEAVEARDISNAVLFLASDEAQYVTGLEFTVDAGNTIR